jgi:formylglycine-generating enzyme required for sulfatase activity
MGSSGGKSDPNEHPQHNVKIGQAFAVSKFELTFAEWDACAEHGECAPHINDIGWGRGRQPAISVNWHDAQTYAKWLSRITGKKYRLLSEAEYEYAARAGSMATFPWGDSIQVNGQTMAQCGDGCDTKWKLGPAPVGSFRPNQFGLYDMIGNVWEWVEDCDHNDYNGAPSNVTPWTKTNCLNHMLRGGSFIVPAEVLSSALRRPLGGEVGNFDQGTRVARTLDFQ